jgi:hypothetical protein
MRTHPTVGIESEQRAARHSNRSDHRAATRGSDGSEREMGEGSLTGGRSRSRAPAAEARRGSSSGGEAREQQRSARPDAVLGY